MLLIKKVKDISQEDIYDLEMFLQQNSSQCTDYY